MSKKTREELLRALTSNSMFVTMNRDYVQMDSSPDVIVVLKFTRTKENKSAVSVLECLPYTPEDEYVLNEKYEALCKENDWGYSHLFSLEIVRTEEWREYSGINRSVQREEGEV